MELVNKMKWFKHMSDSDFDPRMVRLGRKFGLRGIGLYWSALGRIAFRLRPENPIPDLEETARDLAEFYGEDTATIEEIMKWCVDEKLFQINPENKRIMCLKLLLYLDNTMSNNPEIKKILSNFKELEDTSSHLKQIGLKQIRLDKIRLDKKDTTSDVFKCDYFTVSEKKHTSYCTAYPGIDVMGEYSRMSVWLNDNPSRRKSQYPRFVNSWLSRTFKDKNEKNQKPKSIYKDL